MDFEINDGLVNDERRENSPEHKKKYGQLMAEHAKVQSLKIDLEAAESAEAWHRSKEGQSSGESSDMVRKEFLKTAQELGHDTDI